MIRKITKENREYPARFARIGDRPKTLSVWGKIPDAPMIALVGTRRSDVRMNRFTQNLAADLVKRGYVVVSGGALGIDTAAHTGALNENGVTVAVLGSGFDQMYPAKNRAMFEKISQNGAVISEYPAGTPPSKWSFPRRNRLVAAISSAVIVVQAPVKSGALLTAKLALNIGVPVGAVPAVPGDTLATGCNTLIKNGAALITDANDIVNLARRDKFGQQLDLPVAGKQTRPRQNEMPAALLESESAIWLSLSFDPVHIDDIATRTGLTTQVVGSTLLNMEISGLIEDVGGRRFVRL